MKSKQKNNVCLVIACVLSYVTVALSILLALFVAFNLLGVGDLYRTLLVKYLESTNVEADVTMYIIELGLAALMNLYFANYYLKGIKYKVNTKQYGKMLISQSIFQFLLGSALSAIFAMIAGNQMTRKQPAPVENIAVDNPYLSSYKMEAMSEAVRRLKELKEKGAISEEEYYATLNKILES